MTDGPTQMARNQKRRQTEKPTILEAIEMARMAPVFKPSLCTSLQIHEIQHQHLRRLVEAAELWLRFGTLSEKFIKSLDAEKDRRIEGLEAQIEAQKEMRREAYQAAIEETEDAEKLRSQLAAKERLQGGFPMRLGIVEKKLDILAAGNPGCFDDSAPPKPDSAPTEAEVKKVAEIFMKLDNPLATWVTRTVTEQEHYENLARHVIERGYRPEEE